MKLSLTRSTSVNGNWRNWERRIYSATGKTSTNTHCYERAVMNSNLYGESSSCNGVTSRTVVV